MYVPGLDDPAWAAAFPERVGSPATARRKPGEWNIPIEVKHEGSNSGPSSRGSTPPRESEEAKPQGPRVHHIPINVEPRDSASSSRSRPVGDAWESNFASPSPFDTARQRAHSFGNRFFRTPEEEVRPSSPRQAPYAAPQRTRHSSGEKKPPQKPHVTKVFVNQEQQPAASQTPPPPKSPTPPPPPQTTESPEQKSLNKIREVVKQIEDLKVKVDAFQGEYQDKQYRYLDEMLTRCMIMLDDVETYGMDDIRQARKSSIKLVQLTISHLESKANKDQQMDTTESQQVAAEPSETKEEPKTEEVVPEPEPKVEEAEPTVEEPKSAEETDVAMEEQPSSQESAEPIQRSEVTIQLGGDQM